MSTTTDTTHHSPGATAAALYRAVATDDLDAAHLALDPDVVLHVPGTHPLAGRHVGPDAVLRFVLDSRSRTASGERIELLDLLEGREHAAAYCRITAERPGRAPLDNTTVHVLRVREGRITEIWLHNWDDMTVNEFWS